MKTILDILTISLFCVGWVTLLTPGMLLEKLDDQLKKLPKWIYKPLGGCVPCSASIVGLTAYALLYYVPYGRIAVILVAAVGVNVILWFLKDLIIVSLEEKKEILKVRKAQAAQVAAVKNSVQQCKGCGDGKENSLDDAKDK